MTVERNVVFVDHTVEVGIKSASSFVAVFFLDRVVCRSPNRKSDSEFPLFAVQQPKGGMETCHIAVDRADVGELIKKSVRIAGGLLIDIPCVIFAELPVIRVRAGDKTHRSTEGKIFRDINGAAEGPVIGSSAFANRGALFNAVKNRRDELAIQRISQEQLIRNIVVEIFLSACRGKAHEIHIWYERRDDGTCGIET